MWYIAHRSHLRQGLAKPSHARIRTGDLFLPKKYREGIWTWLTLRRHRVFEIEGRILGCRSSDISAHPRRGTPGSWAGLRPGYDAAASLGGRVRGLAA